MQRRDEHAVRRIERAAAADTDRIDLEAGLRGSLPAELD
jgi:hypothetical protein